MPIAAIANSELGSSVRTKLNSLISLRNNVTLVNVRDFGAVGDGLADDTTPFQNAINAAQPVKGRIMVPQGSYLVGALAVGVEGQRYSCEIVGDSWQGDIGQAAIGATRLLLKAATNNHMFTIASTAAPCRFENLYLDGSRGTQTGPSSAFHFTDYVTDSTKQRSAHFYNIRVESFRTHGINIGLLRNAGTMDRVTILNVGNAGVGACVIMGSCNDWRCDRCDFGGAASNGIWLTGGGSSVWTACNSFVNANAGVRIDNTALDNWFIGCSLDTNQQQGANLVGSTQASATSKYARAFINCRFNQNGLAADNTHSDIKLTDELAAMFVGCHFLRGTDVGTGGNLPKYHLEIAGTTDNVIFAGNLYQTVAPIGYRTAAISDPTKVKSRIAGRVNAADLPTSAAGLVSGDLWVDAASANVVKRVP
jgi:hypothetical protein